MYHEEKVIGGILCYRNSPHGSWREFTAKALTLAFLSLNRDNKEVGNLNAISISCPACDNVIDLQVVAQAKRIQWKS